MTSLYEAAEMALEALETLWDILDDIDTASDMAKENDAWYRKRVEALQKKRWDTTITTDGYKLKGGPAEALRQALAQPEQKPVAYLDEGLGAFYWPNDCNKYVGFTPLYAVPPHRWSSVTDEELMHEVRRRGFVIRDAQIGREWVGITEDDVHHAFNYVEMVKLLDFDRDRQAWCENFAAHIEATLRQQNGFGWAGK